MTLQDLKENTIIDSKTIHYNERVVSGINLIVRYGDVWSTGNSQVHPSDISFSSERVGEHIAFLRAIKFIAEQKEEIASASFIPVKECFKEIINAKDVERLDPTFAIRKRYYRLEKQVNDWIKIKHEIDKELNSYLLSQDMATKKIKKIREAKK